MILPVIAEKEDVVEDALPTAAGAGTPAAADVEAADVATALAALAAHVVSVANSDEILACPVVEKSGNHLGR